MKTPVKVNLTEAQTQKLKALWFIYGNNGIKHSRTGHRFIQCLLEHGTDERKFFKPPKEVRTEVDTIINSKKHYPAIEVKIGLVTYGYQIDIYDYTAADKDGNGTEHYTQCYDFGGDYPINTTAKAIAIEFLSAMRALEHNCLRKK